MFTLMLRMHLFCNIPLDAMPIIRLTVHKIDSAHASELAADPSATEHRAAPLPSSATNGTA